MKKLNLGNKDISLEEYVELPRKEIIEVESTTNDLISLALSKDSNIPNGSRDEECKDVDNAPPPCVNLIDARQYVEMIFNFTIMILSC